MIVVVVNFLCRGFKDGNEALRVVSHLHGQVFVKIEQKLHVHLDVVAALASVPLQLLSIILKQKWCKVDWSEISSLAVEVESAPFLVED